MPPFEVEIERLGRGGVGEGVAPDGRPVQVRFAPPGSRLLVVPAGRKRGVWQARRAALVRPAADGEVPPCAQFGLCGGCALQELGLAAQQAARRDLALAAVGAPLGWLPGEAPVPVHPVRGPGVPYGYRNKIELSFGTRRYLSESALAAGDPVEGRFLGFHAPGRFDRVVDAERCWLVGEASNAVLAAVRRVALAGQAPPPWDVRSHQGFWRHLVIREAVATGEVLVAVYTTSPAHDEERVVERLAAEVLGLAGVVGLVWGTDDGVASVARGHTRRTWGRPYIEERLGDVVFRLSATTFFQTSTAGARVLYDAVAEALGGERGTLLDLYCGIGAIGLYLAHQFDRVVGVEEHEQAVIDARENARRNGISHTEVKVARVEEALGVLSGHDAPAVVVDPPRAGLHPRVARALAGAAARELVYVACNPASLGRDAVILFEGGWRLAELWLVDLFPQTGHIEAVARFER